MPELVGVISVSGKRDKEGFRNYSVKHLVKCSVFDGPANVMQTPGLPLYGTIWLFSDDIDVWAWAGLERDVDIHEEKEGDPSEYYVVTTPFTSKPDNKYCKDQQIDDPLLQPPKISGAFVEYNREAARDRFGRAIKYSSHEPVRGQQNEWEEGNPTVKIEMNVSILALGLLCQLNNAVNSSELWGVQARCIKCKVRGWEKKFYGVCYAYYTVTLEFEINWDGWDRNVLDEGNKVLKGHWSPITGEWVLDFMDLAGTILPNPSNPSHFIQATDTAGNPIHVVLDGAGKPVSRTGPTGVTGSISSVLDNTVERHFEVSVTTPAPHNLVEGDLVLVTGMLGPLSLNLDINDKAWFVRVLSDTAFTLRGSVKQIGGKPIAGATDSTFYWATGGTWTQLLNTVPGNVHISKYFEEDFGLLGLPVTF